jgi:hypothetical protein
MPVVGTFSMASSEQSESEMDSLAWLTLDHVEQLPLSERLAKMTQALLVTLPPSSSCWPTPIVPEVSVPTVNTSQ